MCRVTRLPPYNGANCSTSSQSKHPHVVWSGSTSRATQARGCVHGRGNAQAQAVATTHHERLITQAGSGTWRGGDPRTRRGARCTEQASCGALARNRRAIARVQERPPVPVCQPARDIASHHWQDRLQGPLGHALHFRRPLTACRTVMCRVCVCRVTRLPPYNGAKCSTSSQSKHPLSLYPHALKHSTQILLLHTADVETGKKTPPLTALGKEAGFQYDWVICLRRPSSVFCIH